MSSLWQWIFSIIGLVGFMMAFLFFLQLLFGQPHIGYTFRQDDTGGEGRLIKAHLMNPPIKNKLLKVLRVSRMVAQDVYLHVEVRNASTEQVVCNSFAPEIVLSNSNRGVRVNLPPSILMANVTLAKWQRSTNSAVLLCGTQLVPLPEGKYVIHIRMGLDGNIMTFKQAGLLNVGSTEIELKWDERITNTFFT